MLIYEAYCLIEKFIFFNLILNYYIFFYICVRKLKPSQIKFCVFTRKIQIKFLYIFTLSIDWHIIIIIQPVEMCQYSIPSKFGTITY